MRILKAEVVSTNENALRNGIAKLFHGRLR